jgi:hypothetical protein
MELSLSHAAVGNGRECNAISNENQNRSPISLCGLACINKSREFQE